MANVRIAIVVVLALCLLFIPNAGYAQGTAAVSGVITSSTPVTIPANAIVTIQIAEVSSAYPAPRVIVEQRFSTSGAQLPFRFSLPYNPAQINAGRTYSIQGSVTANNATLLSSRTVIPVITMGSPTANVTLTMVPTASNDLPNSSSGTGLLAITGLLVFGVALLRLLRMRVLHRD